MTGDIYRKFFETLSKRAQKTANREKLKPYSHFCIAGDSNKPRAWSKYASDSTAYKKTHPELLEPQEKTEDTKKSKKKSKKHETAALLEKVNYISCNLTFQV